jgi:hypothetical protein
LNDILGQAETSEKVCLGGIWSNDPLSEPLARYEVRLSKDSSCTPHFPKPYLYATLQPVTNGTDSGLQFVFHIEAFWKGHILAKYSRVRSSSASYSFGPELRDPAFWGSMLDLDG